MSRSFLVIQTAFLGDAILATAVCEKLHAVDNTNKIDVLVRKGNESIFGNHPFIRNVLVWEKKTNKYKNLFALLKQIRNNKYDVVINLQRFLASGILTAFSAARETTGFNKNPLSVLFTRRVKHRVAAGIHETDRNQSTIEYYTDPVPAKPKIYPAENEFAKTLPLKQEPYVTISPASVWHTKTFPAYKWIDLINYYHAHKKIKFYLLGAAGETGFAEYIRTKVESATVVNLCGKLNILESAALMKDAQMNYVNDSAPLHLASAMNAPVTAVYCSTVPEFGFGPLSSVSKIIQTEVTLSCRPCGLHGFRECPLVHFKCAHTIEVNQTMLP